MKIRWKKVIYFVMFLGSLVGFKNAVGQNDSIQNKNIESNLSENSFQISGVVRDSSDKTPIPFCNLILIDNRNNQIAGTTADLDGKYILKNIPKGKYYIKAMFVGYEPRIIYDISSEKNIYLNLSLKSIISCYLPAIEILNYKMIDPKNTTSGGTIGGEDIKNMPIRR